MSVTTVLNSTHDPARRSWVASANEAGADFPIQNLPHGVFSQGDGMPRGGVAIGDQILDLKAAIAADLFTGAALNAAQAAAEPTLNRFMEMGPAAASALRARLSDILADSAEPRPDLLVPISAVTMQLPARISGFTDFCSSVPHIEQDRPGRPGGKLHPAFKHLPVAYNSRASSIVPSGVPIARPNGQTGMSKDGRVFFSPTRAMDFELEFGAVIGPPTTLGQPIHIDDAPGHIWGYVLVNDWSSRDVQAWESMLGPFLAKNLSTTISPWIVTAEAMAPFRTAAPERAADDPRPLPYLTSERHEAEGGLSLALTAYLRTAKMREAGEAPVRITRTHFRHSYWSLEQMTTHHASNGCNLQSGDILASGTVSGPEPDEAACLWELAGGTTPMTLPNGEVRAWLADGDEVILQARAEAPGLVSIGFGDCAGELLPAPAWPDATNNPQAAAFP